MNLADVDLAFRELTGLDPTTLATQAFPAAVESRMRAAGVRTPEAYAGLLRADAREVAALSAELVVPETWFFRGGRELFERLAETVAALAADRGRSVPVRILSVPCSTGEEPYSVAIALQERGVPTDRYRIDAADLSPRHLAAARQGLYPSSSFREAGRDPRPDWFLQAGDRWELRPDVRSVVKFRVANLVGPEAFAGEPPYDFVLCRHLFIYLTPEARSAATASLERLLAPDGRLVLSVAEADRLSRDRFTAEGPTAFGIYRRVADRGTVRTAPAPRPIPRASTRPPAAPSRAASKASTEPAPRPAQTLTVAEPPATLDAIRELADAGRLSDAAAACETFLAAAPQSADGHALLGVLLLARGETESAADALRKALYLDPANTEALGHMILVCDRRGDAAQAAALRARLDRRTRPEGP